VWSPQTANDKYAIELVQGRAARRAVKPVHNTSSVTIMLNQLNWPSLESRRELAGLTIQAGQQHGSHNTTPLDQFKINKRPSSKLEHI
jgi:hypothetical protein